MIKSIGRLQIALFLLSGMRWMISKLIGEKQRSTQSVVGISCHRILGK